MKIRKKRSFLPRLIICRGIFGFLFIFSFLYTLSQTVRTSVTHALLIFFVILSAFDVFALLITVFAVRVRSVSAPPSIERTEKGRMQVKFKNYSPFVCNIKAYLTVPDNIRGKTAVKKARFTLAPFCSSVVNADIRFFRLGTVSEGVSEFYVSDMFCIFGIKRRIFSACETTVLPRVLDSRTEFHFEETIGSFNMNSTPNPSGDELSDVREYEPGDTMKQIHWKLSSKDENLYVRSRASENESSVNIVASPFISSPLFDENTTSEAEDTVMEEAFSAALALSEMQNKGNFLVFGALYPYGTESENRRLQEVLADAEIKPFSFLHTEKSKSALFVMPFADFQSASEIFQNMKSFSPSFSACLLLIDLSALIENDKKRKVYEKDLEKFMSAVTDSNMAVTVKKGDFFIV